MVRFSTGTRDYAFNRMSDSGSSGSGNLDFLVFLSELDFSVFLDIGPDCYRDGLFFGFGFSVLADVKMYRIHRF